MKRPTEGMETLAGMEYPGRVIILGRDRQGKHNVVIYALTGRSPSSRARRLVYDGQEAVKSQATDSGRLKKGNERLLIYNCIRKAHDGLVVSNGAQTDLIMKIMVDHLGRGLCPAPEEILRRAFVRPHVMAGIDLTSYEPDGPHFTPRISGCILHGAALSIVKRARDGSAARHYFEIPLIRGRGKLIATYQGQNVDPLPPFQGEPLDGGDNGPGAGP
jgi:IMP cyclohydrolase